MLSSLRPSLRRSTAAASTASHNRAKPPVHWVERITAPFSFRPRKLTDLTSLEQARRIAALCEEKLATDITILDMRSVCDYTDFFVIATGANTRQTKAISDEVHFVLKRDHELLPRAVAGEREGTWIIADYYDSVLHVFTEETREFYRLEDLWNDVPKLEAAASG
jgi:ribosome-associated protein